MYSLIILYVSCVKVLFKIVQVCTIYQQLYNSYDAFISMQLMKMNWKSACRFLTSLSLKEIIPINLLISITKILQRVLTFMYLSWYFTFITFLVENI